MKIAQIGSLFVLLGLAGCGGGSSSNAPPVTSRSIFWMTDWSTPIGHGGYDYYTPSFATSAVLTLTGAAVGGGDFVAPYTVGGTTAPQLLGSSGAVKVGSFPLTALFYFDNGSGGPLQLVGVARAIVTIMPGTPLDSGGRQAADLTLDTFASAVDNTEVPPGQTIKAGATAPLIFTAHPRGVASHILALYPNSESVQVTSGTDHLSYKNGAMTGLTPGTATLTVTALGVASPPVTITITP